MANMIHIRRMAPPTATSVIFNMSSVLNSLLNLSASSSLITTLCNSEITKCKYKVGPGWQVSQYRRHCRTCSFFVQLSATKYKQELLTTSFSNFYWLRYTLSSGGSRISRRGGGAWTPEAGMFPDWHVTLIRSSMTSRSCLRTRESHHPLVPADQWIFLG